MMLWVGLLWLEFYSRKHLGRHSNAMQAIFGDQNLNMRYLCDVGMELEEFERGKIEKAKKRLMVDTEGKEMRTKAIYLKEKVELSLKEGGSCCNSLNDLAEKILSF